MILAIDGPAGSGKSSTARAIAARTGLLYLDTGAMYRAVALRFLEAGAEVTEKDAVDILDTLNLDIRYENGDMILRLDGRDVTGLIRTRDVATMSSRVSTLAPVQKKMVEEQRRIAEQECAIGKGVVIEGRDIGTVVFPEADVKIFMDADPRERTRRRIRDLKEAGESPDEEEIFQEIVDRDRRDRSRDLSPLRPAEDAIFIDTTILSFSKQIDMVESAVRERLG